MSGFSCIQPFPPEGSNRRSRSEGSRRQSNPADFLVCFETVSHPFILYGIRNVNTAALPTAGQGFNWIICNIRPPFSNLPPAPRSSCSALEKKITSPVPPLLRDILAADEKTSWSCMLTFDLCMSECSRSSPPILQTAQSCDQLTSQRQW